MRQFLDDQMKMGEVSIDKIKIDHRSRDEIPHLLFGLQYIYSNQELRQEVFSLLQRLIPEDVNQDFGRPGMHLWKILVLGVIRLGCNIDFDKLHDLANNHLKIREFLLHTEFDRSEYSLSTIRDNVQLFTPEILDEINNLVVKAGHKLLKKKTLKKRAVGFRSAATLSL